jgi:hypothetical protein
MPGARVVGVEPIAEGREIGEPASTGEAENAG